MWSHTPGLPSLHEENARFLRSYIDKGRFVAQPPCVLVCTGSPVTAMSSAAWLWRCRSAPIWMAGSDDTSSPGSRARTRLRSTSTACAPRRAPCPSPIEPMTGSEVSSTRRRKTGPRSPTPPMTVSSTTSGCSKERMRTRSSPPSVRSRPLTSPTDITGAPRRPDSRRPVRMRDCSWCCSPTTSSESCRTTVSCAIWACIPPNRSSPALPRASPSSRCRAATPEAAQPRARGEFAVHVDGRWFRFRLSGDQAHPSSPADAIDAAILQARVIGPLLGITDPRDDERPRLRGRCGRPRLARTRLPGGLARRLRALSHEHGRACRRRGCRSGDAAEVDMVRSEAPVRVLLPRSAPAVRELRAVPHRRRAVPRDGAVRPSPHRNPQSVSASVWRHASRGLAAPAIEMNRSRA